MGIFGSGKGSKTVKADKGSAAIGGDAETVIVAETVHYDPHPSRPPPPPQGPRPAEALAQLEATVRAGQDLDVLPKALYEEIIRYYPDTPADFHLRAIASWHNQASKIRIDKAFTRLTLLLHREELQQNFGFAEDKKYRELRDIPRDLNHLPLVLLGAPGSGKSTLLRRYAFDEAMAAVVDGEASSRLAFFVPLNSFPDAGGAEPGDWLAQRWAAKHPYMPTLADLLRAGRMVLLVDALNEMPRHSGRDYEQKTQRWSLFLRDLLSQAPGNPVLFSCRSLDYSAPLVLESGRVPHVRIERLSEEDIQRFLKVHCPVHAVCIWDYIDNHKQQELYDLPYYLWLLVRSVEGNAGTVPDNRAELFSGFVRDALRRDIEEARNPLFDSTDLLTARDKKRLPRLRGCALPEDGRLIDGLAGLGYGMQDQHRSDSSNTQVVIGYEAALELLGMDDERGDRLLEAGVAIQVLEDFSATPEDNEEAAGSERVQFVHQLMQEYFAARKLARAPDPQRVASAWRAEQTTPTLEAKLQELKPGDPLPPPPTTGWEETTLLAGIMASDPDAFVAGLEATNLPLAGRCAAQRGVAVSAETRERLQSALFERTGDRAADLRARIAAGLALGELGHPAFERRRGALGHELLLPPLVEIAGGDCVIGTADGHYGDEGPPQSIRLAPFAMGRYPVTNAEWRCFVEAGGYQDERWWQGCAADRQWWEGKSSAAGDRNTSREFRRCFRADADNLRRFAERYAWEEEIVADWQRLIDASEEAFEAELAKRFPGGPKREPEFWQDERFNNAAQPVVGVCWHEARAYCAWLNANLELDAETGFRLPTEGEWEAAARGRPGRTYAWGDELDPERSWIHCNIFESHVRATTPIGVFPAGATPETGLMDLTGNVWEWTASRYEESLWHPAAGRESPQPLKGASPESDRRAVRGGSWYFDLVFARGACRNGLHPAGRDHALGLRMVRSSPIRGH